MISTISVMNEIRVRIRDEGKIEIGSDNVLIPYINEAISWLNSQLISLQDPCMIVETDIMDKSTVPADFVKFVGQHPLAQSGNVFKIIDGSDSVSARYWANKPRITSDSDTIDFPDQNYNKLVQYAATAVLNKLGQSIEQDLIMLKQLNGTLIQAKKG